MNQQSNGIAIASLVLGIVALCCLFSFRYIWVGIIAAVVGLILGIVARKQTPSSMATAGFVLSIIALAVCTVSFVACVACLGILGSIAF